MERIARSEEEGGLNLWRVESKCEVVDNPTAGKIREEVSDGVDGE